jgi:predicted alpha/beta-hydrolase family hydrolase
MLFLQGTKDELATWDLIEPLCASLKSATLVKIEGANHAFKVAKLNVPQLLADASNEWIAKLIKKTK